MDSRAVAPARAGLVRIGTFRVPADDERLHGELRDLADRPWGRCRWVGRRLVDDGEAAEVAVVSVWDDRDQMVHEVEIGQRAFSRQLRAAVAGMTTELYECRAFGAWTRSEEPSVVRIFRGELAEGDPDRFDETTAATYVGMFESNGSCCSIVAGIGDAAFPEGGIVLASLWTSWDAIARATSRNLARVLPVRLPGWSVAGAAVHYEVVAAESREAGFRNVGG